MYLAARVGRWSTTVIGRFYNGRDHSTVCHGIQRIEALRESNPEVDALLCELMKKLTEHTEQAQGQDISAMRVPGRRYQVGRRDIEQLANTIADRFAERMRDLLEEFFGKDK